MFELINEWKQSWMNLRGAALLPQVVSLPVRPGFYMDYDFCSLPPPRRSLYLSNSCLPSCWYFNAANTLRARRNRPCKPLCTFQFSAQKTRSYQQAYCQGSRAFVIFAMANSCPYFSAKALPFSTFSVEVLVFAALSLCAPRVVKNLCS